MSWLNRSEAECQPCDNFTGDGGYYGPTPHECFAPFDGRQRTEPCSGRVYFCRNCNRDHHSAGYNSCRYVPAHCEHPACVAARAKDGAA